MAPIKGYHHCPSPTLPEKNRSMFKCYHITKQTPITQITFLTAQSKTRIKFIQYDVSCINCSANALVLMHSRQNNSKLVSDVTNTGSTDKG